MASEKALRNSYALVRGRATQERLEGGRAVTWPFHHIAAWAARARRKRPRRPDRPIILRRMEVGRSSQILHSPPDTDCRIADCWRWRGADCGLWPADAKNAATIRLSKGRKARERSERRKF